MAWTTTTTYLYQWDAGAHSIATLGADGCFTFQVGQATGVVAGFSNTDASTDYREIQHGFWIEGIKSRIIELGTFKTALITHAQDVVYKVERVAGVVKYYRDDVLVYTSLTASTGTVILDASLIGYHDELLNLTRIDAGEGDYGYEASITLPHLRMAGSTDGDDPYGAIQLTPLIVVGDDVDVNAGSALLPSFIVGGTVDGECYGRILLSPFFITNDMEVPFIATGQIELGPLYVRGASYEAESALLLPALHVYGLDAESDLSGCAVLPALTAHGVVTPSALLLGDWGDWQFFLSDYPADQLVSGAIITDTLRGVVGAALEASATNSATLSAVFEGKGTLAETQATTDVLRTAEATTLAESQGASLVLTTTLRTSLALAAASSQTLAGASELKGTLADSQASVLGFGAVVLTTLADEQASTLALTGVVGTALTSSSATSDALVGASELKGTLADAALAQDALALGIQVPLLDEQASILTLTGALATALASTAVFSDALAGALDTKGTLTDAALTQDAVAFIAAGPLTDSQSSTLALTAAFRAPLWLAATSSTPVAGVLELFTELSDGLSGQDALDGTELAALNDTQGSSAELVIHYLGDLADSATLASTLGGSINVYRGLADTQASADTLGGRLTLIGLLAETGVGGDSFTTQAQTVYAINAETGAVSTYVFTPLIQGAAAFDGALYLATPDGLFALDNTTDQGTAIDWELRTGLLNLGTDALKRITDMNVVGRATGDVGVNLVHDRDGTPVERRYVQTRLNRTAARDGVVKTGRGPVSVYWQVGVAGIGPAEIAELRLRVEPTSRRR